MNALINMPQLAPVLEHPSSRVWEGKVELTYRALLLSVPFDDACQRLNRSSPHDRWPSVVYRELAAREANRLSRRASARRSSRPMSAVVEELRSCVRSPSEVHAHDLADLLFEAAFRYRVYDPVLLERLLDEVDALVFRTVESRRAACTASSGGGPI